MWFRYLPSEKSWGNKTTFSSIISPVYTELKTWECLKGKLFLSHILCGSRIKIAQFLMTYDFIFLYYYISIIHARKSRKNTIKPFKVWIYFFREIRWDKFTGNLHKQYTIFKWNILLKVNFKISRNFRPSQFRAYWKSDDTNTRNVG